MIPYLILIVTTILVGLVAVLLYRRKDTPDPKVFLVSCVRSLVTRRSSCAWRFQDPLWGVISRAEACGFDRV